MGAQMQDPGLSGVNNQMQDAKRSGIPDRAPQTAQNAVRERYRLANFLLHPEDHFYINDLLLDRGAHITAHRHDYYEFYVVLRGEFYEQMQGRRVRVGQRQAHILAPDDEHNLYASDQLDGNVLRNIAVDQSTFWTYLAAAGVGEEKLYRYFTLDEGMFGAFEEKTELTLASYPGGKPFDFLMRGVLYDILIAALMQSNNDQAIPRWLREAYAHMAQEENFVAGLPRFVELTGKSQEHLTRAFRKYYGTTPTDYINLLRLQHAAWLLQTGEEKVIDILYACGFDSVSYFNRLFKARYGMTPSQYKEKKKFFF